VNFSNSSLTVIGRPVRVVSIGFEPGRTLEQVSALVDAEAAPGADLMVLPESFLGQNAVSMESLDGPSVRAFSNLAKKHRTYIVCPIDRVSGERRFNSAVLIDRNGEIRHVYDKIHPLWYLECERDPPVCSGDGIAVCDTDFGRVGIAICFDVNWPEQWRRMAQMGAELVVWPSAYSAGRALQAHAIQNHFYIVSSTWIPDCSIYDIDGEQIVFDRHNRGGGLNVTRATLDLDRCIFHADRNESLMPALLAAHPNEVIEDKRLERERWFILKAIRAGASARELAGRHGLLELNPYLESASYELGLRQAGVMLSALAGAGTARG